MIRTSVALAAVLLLAGAVRAEGSIHLEVKGKLQTGIVAIGAETTGTVIRTSTGFACEVAGKVDKDLNGKTVIVTGSYAVKPGVEIRQRAILTAEKIVEAKEKPDEYYVRATIKGKVTTGVLAPGGATTGITITAAGTTWELNATGDPKLLEQVRALNGKEAEVTGTVEMKRLTTRPGVRTIVTVTGVKPLAK